MYTSEPGGHSRIGRDQENARKEEKGLQTTDKTGKENGYGQDIDIEHNRSVVARGEKSALRIALDEYGTPRVKVEKDEGNHTIQVVRGEGACQIYASMG